MKTKVFTLTILWVTLGISIIFIDPLHIRIFLVVVGIGVTVHILTLKTLGNEELRELMAIYYKNPKKA